MERKLRRRERRNKNTDNEEKEIRKKALEELERKSQELKKENNPKKLKRKERKEKENVKPVIRESKTAGMMNTKEGMRTRKRIVKIPFYLAFSFSIVLAGVHPLWIIPILLLTYYHIYKTYFYFKGGRRNVNREFKKEIEIITDLGNIAEYTPSRTGGKAIENQVVNVYREEETGEEVYVHYVKRGLSKNDDIKMWHNEVLTQFIEVTRGLSTVKSPSANTVYELNIDGKRVKRMRPRMSKI